MRPDFYYTTTFRCVKVGDDDFGTMCVFERTDPTEADAFETAMELVNGEYPGLQYQHTTRYEYVGPGPADWHARVIDFTDDIYDANEAARQEKQEIDRMRYPAAVGR